MADEVVATAGRRVGVESHTVAARLTLAELTARGALIGASITAPALVTLTGDLGAGKTTLVQAICSARGVTEPVTSPTFALVHEYASAGGRVVHCDLYRLNDAREVAALGLEEMLADPETIVMVEWAERAGNSLGQPTMAITLAHVDDDDTVRLCSETWAT